MRVSELIITVNNLTYNSVTPKGKITAKRIGYKGGYCDNLPKCITAYSLKYGLIPYCKIKFAILISLITSVEVF
jgi:hypothetical protein